MNEVGDHLYILTQSEPPISPPSYAHTQSLQGQAIDAYKDHMSPYQSYYQQMNGYHDQDFPPPAFPHPSAVGAYNPYSNYSNIYDSPYLSQYHTHDRHKLQWPSERLNG